MICDNTDCDGKHHKARRSDGSVLYTWETDPEIKPWYIELGKRSSDPDDTEQCYQCVACKEFEHSKSGPSSRCHSCGLEQYLGEPPELGMLENYQCAACGKFACSAFGPPFRCHICGAKYAPEFPTKKAKIGPEIHQTQDPWYIKLGKVGPPVTAPRDTAVFLVVNSDISAPILRLHVLAMVQTPGISNLERLIAISVQLVAKLSTAPLAHHPVAKAVVSNTLWKTQIGKVTRDSG